MATNTLVDRLRDRLQRFRADQRGNVAITFALALIPIFGIVGAAVDYSRAHSARTAMQAALDSTALMLAKEVGSTSLSSAQISQKANDYFAALFKRPEALNIQLASSYDTSTNRVLVKGSATVDTTIARVMGITQIPIATSSEVVAGLSKKVEIVLVLDNTGSMATSGKIDALKSASHQLLDTLKKTAKKPDDIKVAIIPFDIQVNVGQAYASKPWIDWTILDSSGGGGGDDDDDNTRNDGNNDKGSHKSWKGCLIDRTQPYDVQDTTPTSDSATWYPAVNCDLPVMQPLTSDWTALHAKVDEMKPKGKTNLTIGLVWGWHALTPNEPLTEAAAPSKQILKYLVFLTDGLNTQNRWTTKPADIDARTKVVCSNIKAAEIRLFTVRVLEGNEALLQSCASDPTMYYNVTAANQLNGVFAMIAKELTQIRIAR
jgi:Flp pilus assembly protein TadG